MKNLFFAFIALCFAVVPAMAWNEDNYPLDMYGTEFIPGIGDESSEKSYMYVFANEDHTQVKFVEPKYHIEPVIDSFTLYHDNSFILPEQITVDGKICKVIAIESDAFNAPGINSITLPSSLEIIEPGVIAYCPDLTMLKLNEGLRLIMRNSFCKLDKLRELAIPGSVYEIQDGCFKNIASLESLNFGEGLFYIGNNCFINLDSLDEVILPKSLKSLGEGCFNNCRNLKKVTIPKWVKSVDNSFNKCPEIQEIHFLSKSANVLINESFKDVDMSKCRVIVPDGCKKVYQDSKAFPFTNILEESEALSGVKELPFNQVSQSVVLYNLNGIIIQSDNIPKGELYIKSENGVSTLHLQN